MKAHRLTEQGGFTLLEVMIVIIIIAIGAASVQLLVVDRDPLAKIDKTARTFSIWFGTQQDKSLLSNEEIGLYFTEHQIALLSWREGDVSNGEEDIVWEVVNEVDYASGLNELRVELTLGLDLQEWVDLEAEIPEETYGLQPHIIIFPSEEYSPAFSLAFHHVDHPDEYLLVTGDGFNRLGVSRETP